MWVRVTLNSTLFLKINKLFENHSQQHSTLWYTTKHINVYQPVTMPSKISCLCFRGLHTVSARAESESYASWMLVYSLKTFSPWGAGVKKLMITCSATLDVLAKKEIFTCISAIFSVVDLGCLGDNSLTLLSLRSRVYPPHLNLSGFVTTLSNRTG